MKRENVPVFSASLANILLDAGFDIKNVGPNYNGSGKTVFYFGPKEGLQGAIEEYSAKKKQSKAEQPPQPQT